MTETLQTAIVTAASTSLVAVVALVTNNKRMDDIVRSIERLSTRIDRLEDRLHKLEDTLASYVLDVARIKERLKTD